MDTTESSNEISFFGANTAFIVLAFGVLYPKMIYNKLENIINWCENNGIVCVLQLQDLTDSVNQNDNFEIVLNYWNEIKDLLNNHKDYIIVNIAKEWKVTCDQRALWANTYTSAIKNLRNNGIENAIMISASGYGQENGPVLNDIKKVLEADINQNIIFSYYLYSVSGENYNSLKTALDGLKNTEYCWIFGAFGWWFNAGDDVYENLNVYSSQNKIGQATWTWARNGGIDRNSKNDDLNGIEDYKFYSKYGIQKLSKLSDNYRTYKTQMNTEKIFRKNISLEVNMDPGELTKYDWKFCINADADIVPNITTMEKLSNGGIRANVDLRAENYPTLFILNETGYDLSSYSRIYLIIRNNNENPIQINLILKAGSSNKWYEQNNQIPYIDIGRMMTQIIIFNIENVGSNITDIKQISFRIQANNDKIRNSVDFCYIGFDEPKGSFIDEISEMNSPKSADYFTWSYPDNTAIATPPESVKIENGVISFLYKIQGNIYGGCQTETMPGLSLGFDFSNYKMIKATLTNKGSSSVRCNIIVKTGAGWRWAESAGAKILGGPENEEQIIEGGKTVRIFYYLLHSFWKTQNTNWQYTDKLVDLNDVRAIEFKVYTTGEDAQGIFEISNFEICK